MNTQKKMVLHQNDKGLALIVVLLLMAIMATMSAVAIHVATSEMNAASFYKSRTQAFYAAEAGAEFAFNKLRDALQTLNSTIPNTAPTISGYTFTAFSVQTIGTLTAQIKSGPYNGLTAYITTYQITSKAHKTGTYAYSQINVTVRDELVPIFQFGVFYNSDLELIPGQNMTFSGYSGLGRIHSNQNIYLASSATFSINVPVTTAGSIYNRRKDDGTSPGPVRIQDANGVYHNLTTTNDSSSLTWRGDSQTTWLGSVKSGVNGISALNLPTASGSSNPIDIIGDTAADSMYNRAGLKIVDGVGKDKNNNTVELRYYDDTYRDPHNNHLIIDPGGTASLNVNPVSTGSTALYDQREGHSMTVTTVDIGKLEQSTNAMTALNNPPVVGGTVQDANILYIESSSVNSAVKLINGATLPSIGLTVASKNPVYVKGDYNTTNNPTGNPVNNPAAILADAVTVLSNNWDDAHSNSSIGSRTATATTVNAAIMAGNKNTQGSQYSGGVENLIRFLENWQGINFNYGGSLVCLWESQQATGNWPGNW
ncbi:MAG: PilX N-terminal domain-containing pilus assembly protein, partial [Pseudomonadota bacterium]